MLNSVAIECLYGCRKFHWTSLLWTMTGPAEGGRSALAPLNQDAGTINKGGWELDGSSLYRHTSFRSRTLVKAREMGGAVKARFKRSKVLKSKERIWL